MCNGEYILCKIAHKIIIDKIEEIAMEVIVETELHGLPQKRLLLWKMLRMVSDRHFKI